MSTSPLRARLEGGGTPKMQGRWEIKSETGPLKDVLLGPAEGFRWMGWRTPQWSSLVRDTMRKGYKFDKQVAMRQHREMVDAYMKRRRQLPLPAARRAQPLPGLCA
jgi:hypothetical protein